MGFAYVEISDDFLTEWITKGFRTAAVECWEGLPEGAMFQCSDYLPEQHIVRLIYSHESFECPAIYLLDREQPLRVSFRQWFVTDEMWATLTEEC